VSVIHGGARNDGLCRGDRHGNIQTVVRGVVVDSESGSTGRVGILAGVCRSSTWG